MQKRSAGLLMFRREPHGLEVLLAHPGGPIWAKKDLGAWTIPKGEFSDPEDPLAAAIREFQEETGFSAAGDFLELGSVKQKSGKVVYAWAVEGNCDPSLLQSTSCEIEWPPRSGRKIRIPEVDRGEWFSLEEAHARIMPAQIPFLDSLEKAIGRRKISA
jgi:predicted NUDIX family NTP pyrophosphohydrolase